MELLREEVLERVLDRSDRQRNQYFITEGVPNIAILGNNRTPETLIDSLGDQQIAPSEYDLLIRDVHVLNEQGIFHHDMISNVFPHRGDRRNSTFLRHGF